MHPKIFFLFFPRPCRKVESLPNIYSELYYNPWEELEMNSVISAIVFIFLTGSLTQMKSNGLFSACPQHSDQMNSGDTIELFAFDSTHSRQDDVGGGDTVPPALNS